MLGTMVTVRMVDSLDRTALDALADQVAQARRETLQACAELIDVQADYQAAVAQVRALMFIERFARDIELRYEQLEQQGGRAAA